MPISILLVRFLLLDMKRWKIIQFLGGTFLILSGVLVTLVYVYYPSSFPQNIPIKPKNYTKAEASALFAHKGSLSIFSQACVRYFIHVYEKSVFDWCERTGAGTKVGGGCYHVAYAYRAVSVLEEAMQACGVGPHFEKSSRGT